MIGKKLLQIELFHPGSKIEAGIPRGLTLANSILLSLGLGVFLNNLFQLRIHFILIILLITTFSSLIMLLDKNKKNILCYIIIVGVIVAAVVISKIFHFKYVDVFIKVYDWCLTYDREEIHYQRWNGFAVMAGILLCSCILTYVLHRFKKVKYFMAIILPTLLIVCSIKHISIPKATVCVVIFYSITILVEFCGKLLYKSSNIVDNSIATIYLAPACIIIALVAIMFPSKPEPIQWNGVKNMIQTVQEKGSIWMTELSYLFDKTGNAFSVSFSGYSDENSDELGGEVNVNKKTSLIITAPNKSTARGYLIGSISDNYTGRNWEKSEITNDYQKEDYYLDFYEILTAIAEEEELGSDLTNVIKQRSFIIEYYDIRTRTLFYPLKTYEIIQNKKFDIKETGQGAFLFKTAKGIRTKYQTLYYELNLNSEVMFKMLRRGGGLDYSASEETLKLVAKNIFDYDISLFENEIEVMKQSLIERSGSIKANYTTLPDTLPKRVRQLAYELTKDYTNDYDKLKAIEAYLNTLTYTTRVGKTPKGEDFVDYFLFEQQQGYCTYFATAMGILSRCIGIPTRYVEGYVIDYKIKENLNAYKILSSNAHSWVDAYIEGIGWIPFEPTPTFYAGRYTPWRELTANINNEIAGVNPEDYMGIPTNYQDLVDGVKDEYSMIIDKKARSAKYILSIFIIIFCIIFMFIGIVIVYYLILVKRYNKRYIKASNNKKLSFILAETLRYLSIEGFRLSNEETILSYAERIGDRINYNSTNFLDVTNIFMNVRYGEKEVKEDELLLTKQFCKHLEKDLKEKIGKRKMFFDRFAFLHFY